MRLLLTFLYTHYINQYTAKDTVGKGYGDLTANIILNGEKLKAFPLKVISQVPPSKSIKVAFL